MRDVSGYELSRKFWNWAFDNPEIVKPIHSALYFFAVEHCNRLGWKYKFGLPTTMAMEAMGVSNYKTYKTALDLLEKNGFVKFYSRSKNQYSANVISLFALVKNTKAPTEALSKALHKHGTKHDPKQGTKQVHSVVSINKPRTEEPITINKEQDGCEGLQDFVHSEKAEKIYTLKNDIDSVIENFNIVCGSDYKKSWMSMRDQIKVLFDEGFTIEQIDKVVRVYKKMSTEKSDRGGYKFDPAWVRPNTLFQIEKFPAYHEMAKDFDLTKKKKYSYSL